MARGPWGSTSGGSPRAPEDATSQGSFTDPSGADVVATFYERHPYPPPVTDLTGYAASWTDGVKQRVDHHRMWPHLPFRDDHTILVAGCGTSQAAKYAVRYPRATVVGIDVSQASLEHTELLARRHDLQNLELVRLPIAEADQLETTFDHIVCTGVLHHLADPDEALLALRGVLEPDGALVAMVYAQFGRTGVYMIQDYCRRLGVGTSAEELSDLVASLREISLGHPLSHILRNTPDFGDSNALADALLHPRDRSYTVPQLFEFVRRSGLDFGRWIQQAPYLPTCGSLATVPHGSRIAQLDDEEQFAAVELYRGTMTRHSFIAHHTDSTKGGSSPGFEAEGWRQYVPLVPPTVVAVEERLPQGAAAALLNRAHEFTDLVLFVDEEEKAVFDAINGERSMGYLGAERRGFFERLFDHDLIAIDASRT